MQMNEIKLAVAGVIKYRKFTPAVFSRYYQVICPCKETLFNISIEYKKPFPIKCLVCGKVCRMITKFSPLDILKDCRVRKLV